MLKQKAIVTQTYVDGVDVEYEVNSSCSSCASEDSCGVGTVAKAFSGKTQRIRLYSSLVLSIGQTITIGTQESNILIAASITYLLPLVGLISGSVLGQSFLVGYWGLESYSAIFMGIAGGFIAQRVGRYWLKNNIDSQPKIVIVSGDFT